MSSLLNKSNQSISQYKKKEILCVEGDADSCYILTFFLSEAGYDVTATETAEEGLELARGCGFNLILLDIRYRDGNGIEICGDIRRFDANTPILFYSGETDGDQVAAALSAGAQAYVIKPHIESLLPVVAQMLSGAMAVNHNLPKTISHQTEYRI
jgi:DNA-binding response OmpR family regulator